ncbi:hypothetical protein GCM10010174_45090 [Kutzneria viridogrisea]
MGERDPNGGVAVIRPALVLSRVLHRYDGTTAVEHLTLSVPTRSLYGLLGPRGAGKSTVLDIAAGLRQPTSGRVRVFGVDPSSDPTAVTGLVGSSPRHTPELAALTARELLVRAGTRRGLEAEVAARHAQELLHAFALGEVADRVIADSPAGTWQRLAVAAAMPHFPRLLVLDDPFAGAGAHDVEIITTLLRRYVSAGRTVLLATDSRALAERTCTHLAVLDRGRLTGQRILPA